MKKEQLIKAHLEKPYEVGEYVLVKGLGTNNNQGWFNEAKILRIVDDGIFYEKYGREEFAPFSDIRRSTHNVGFNPFNEPDWQGRPRTVNYTLESILHLILREDKYESKKGFPINSVTFNPYVEINGEKHYYQRDLVWTLEDKQLLLDSIYNNINCGSIIIRMRSFEWNDTRTCAEDTSFKDVVDGKQRLNAIIEFMNDGYPDSNGVFYSEFSRMAQKNLTDHQLFTYAEFGENAKDQDVIQQFLKVNFSGKPQSKEHIDFVKEINQKF